jgi:hypothetical protein
MLKSTLVYGALQRERFVVTNPANPQYGTAVFSFQNRVVEQSKT